MADKIAIVVGHGKSEKGGYDPGACANGYEEFKLARECAKAAQEYLNANYDCKADLFNYKGDLYLTERIKKFKDNTYKILAEIHLNAGKGTGTEVYYSKYSKGKTGQKAAEKVASQIAKDFSIKNRGAKIKLNSSGKDYFAIIRETKPDALLVETLFIDSADHKLIIDAKGQAKMGKAIAVGIASALGLKAKAAYTLYTVKTGDSFWKIASQQMGSGLKCSKLASYNGLKLTSVIRPGQVLKIPK